MAKLNIDKLIETLNKLQMRLFQLYVEIPNNELADAIHDEVEFIIRIIQTLENLL